MIKVPLSPRLRGWAVREPSLGHLRVAKDPKVGV